MSTATTIGLQTSPALAIPLIGSSLTVFYAFTETAIFYSFLRAAEHDPATASKAVRLWWTYFLTPGVSFIFATTIPTIIGGYYTLKDFPQGSYQWKLIVAGITFALGHFLYVPIISGTILSITDQEVERRQETLGMVRKWLKIHFWRFFSTDLPALLCFTALAYGL
ncbi:hypothetical protein LTR84_005195 [Exophiala bonariae]|uniref:Integral membrane protein n=1 Tax=Exophiala bonariae TaxID=1690606 RepID=A0AAV9NRS0_9EURO|nr:hypothetical protein LTR84_005195 [Exophiala bonariae]